MPRVAYDIILFFAMRHDKLMMPPRAVEYATMLLPPYFRALSPLIAAAMLMPLRYFFHAAPPIFIATRSFR